MSTGHKRPNDHVFNDPKRATSSESSEPHPRQTAPPPAIGSNGALNSHHPQVSTRPEHGGATASATTAPTRPGDACTQGRSVVDPAHPPGLTTRHEVESLGVSLGPALHDARPDRLGDIEWFQSPWQRSGAATGFTSWRLPDGQVIEAIVKVPVSYSEYFWSTQLGEVDHMWWESPSCLHLPVPRVLASGTELAGYDVAWLVLERVSGKPISSEMNAESLERLFEAAAKFHAMAGEIKSPSSGRRESELDWPRLLERAEEACRDNPIPEAEGWVEMIGRVRGLLPALLERWGARPIDTWCHGDLHPGNVMTRCSRSCPDDRCGVLIDLAMVRPGHWVEDALYIERLYWGREETLAGVDPLECLARQRRVLGLPVGDEDRVLADVRRVLMGATSPAFLRQENDPVYLSAALERLCRITPCLGGMI